MRQLRSLRRADKLVITATKKRDSHRTVASTGCLFSLLAGDNLTTLNRTLDNVPFLMDYIV